jgi:hypothetical protein
MWNQVIEEEVEPPKKAVAKRKDKNVAAHTEPGADPWLDAAMADARARRTRAEPVGERATRPIRRRPVA